MKKFIQEFKTFATKGNVFDLAVGIIIGGAFGKIVGSFVNDLFMPIISFILGKTNFADLRVVIVSASNGNAELAITYGKFVQTLIDFLLIALVVFMMVKFINRFKAVKSEASVAPPASAEPSNEEKLLAEIRDLLKSKP
ncbi:MAG: large-conductance mechanosensitive channel protein MscL [bacterium]|nr:large-conductance mechanosensitive channel protein MscL [bacterium]